MTDRNETRTRTGHGPKDSRSIQDSIEIDAPKNLAPEISGLASAGAIDGLYPMATAPKDGSIFLIAQKTPDGEIELHEASWYKTRQFRKGIWAECGWWNLVSRPRQQLAFDPAGWKKRTPQ